VLMLSVRLCTERLVSGDVPWAQISTLPVLCTAWLARRHLCNSYFCRYVIKTAVVLFGLTFSY